MSVGRPRPRRAPRAPHNGAGAPRRAVRRPPPPAPLPAAAAAAAAAPGLAMCSTSRRPGASPGWAATDPGRRRALFPVPRDPGPRAPHLRALARRRTFPRGAPRGPPAPPRSLSRPPPPALQLPGSAQGIPSRRHFPASPRSWEVSELLSALKEEEQWGGAFRFSLLPFYWLLDDFYSLSLIQEETAKSLGELHY